MTTSSFDIVVVGGGPVGAAAALALQQRGFSIALVERAAAPPPYDPAGYDLRVYAIAPHSARLLERLGVWRSIRERRISPYCAMRVWERGPEHALAFDGAGNGLAELGWIVEHGLVVDALWRQLGAVRCYERAQVQSAQFGAAGSSLQLADGRELRARLIVAADGADSQLRGLAGIDTVSWPYAQRAIVCHVQTSRPHRQTAWQRFLGSGPLAFLPLADGRCSIVWSADEALAQALLKLDDAAFLARLNEASEQALGKVLETTPRICFPLRLLHAQAYAREGLVLIGDAAHAIHPLAGQGVNLGFADVEQLAAELAQAREAGRDWAALRALQRYARARKAANLEMLAVTDGLYRAFRLRLPGVKAVLGLGMEAVGRLGPLKDWLARQAAL
ncbi:MAG: UbiH/UbiF/VisC/COQ6 family ubiquinone biosynthesis hydroxylase [Nevskia sp.]|nr:UbiH/UbiF/VisC/COQ6 family ubiquinone biosynthesis hydroxylase [Nevskia sp.]